MRKPVNPAHLIFLILLSAVLCFGQSNSWNGITPLYSTRADVEKLLGKPKECKYSFCEYETDKERVAFTYIDFRCERGWDVSKDTVSGIVVEEKNLVGKNYSELNLDESKFKILGVNDILTTEWLNVDEGISYFFDAQRIFQSKTFQPKKSDNNLRCNGFPPYAPEDGYYLRIATPIYNPKERANDVFYSIIAGFDSLIEGKRRIKGSKAYAFVYFDNKLSLSEYRKRVKKIKDFLIKRQVFAR